MKECTLLISKNNNFFATIFNKVFEQISYHFLPVDKENIINYLSIKDLKYLLIDMSVPENIDILKELKLHFPFLPLIVIFPILHEMNMLELASKNDIYFIDMSDNILEDLKNIIAKIEIKQKKQLKEKHNLVFLGKSPQILFVKEKVEKLALTDCSLLITGETGTGKQIVANMIHHLSREGKPYVEINCSSFTASFIESELFGYEKGAFTGAVNSYRGKLDLVKDGTLILDEIGEMDLSLQAKLLHVLEGRDYYSLGSNEPKRFNGRIIACTNKNLMKAIENNEFRKDLYYRLNHFYIKLPTLRERKEDIKILIDYYFSHYSDKYFKSNIKLHISALETLYKYDYPGNVRELETIVKRLIIYTNDDCVLKKDVVENALFDSKNKLDQSKKEKYESPYLSNVKEFYKEEDSDKGSIIPLKLAMELQEKKYLTFIIENEIYKNMSEMAKGLNIQRSSLYRKINQHKIQQNYK